MIRAGCQWILRACRAEVYHGFRPMFEHLPTFPPDPLFHLLEQFKRDPNPRKLNLGIGVYATEQGEPYVMPSVRRAAAAYSNENFNYLPIGGHSGFLEKTGGLLFGSDWNPDGFVSQGACGGTQAIALVRALAKAGGISSLLLAGPTWVNHRTIFSDFDIRSFAHLDEDGRPNVAAYRAAIEAVDAPTVLLLHGGPTHNPTGLNLSVGDLEALVPVIRSKPILTFVDFAYWGLGDGFEEDARGVRLLARELDDVAVGVSFSKNATLYCHRTGALFVKTARREAIETNLRRAVRTTGSNPPAFGEAIMADVLTSHLDAWRGELEEMRRSVERRRAALIERSPRLSYLKDTRGLFGMLRLTDAQVDRLRTEFGIYIPAGGRVNLSGLRTDAIESFAVALEAV